MSTFASKHNLKASFTLYKKWGSKNNEKLIFSKSSNPKIEKQYATHYVSLSKIINKENI